MEKTINLKTGETDNKEQKYPLLLALVPLPLRNKGLLIALEPSYTVIPK